MNLQRHHYLIAAYFLVALLFATLFRSTAFSQAGGKKGVTMFSVSSSSFSNGGAIAKKFTCDAADVSPQLSWTDPPVATRSFALLVDDPDAPVGNWNH